MGEKQENDQRSANTAKRPSPTSVKELLDIVHLQQASVSPRSIAVKQDGDVLSSRGLNPLPAIGRSSGSPHVRNIQPPKMPASGVETRTRANSDGCQYKGNMKGLSSSLENSATPGILYAQRDGVGHPAPGRSSQHPGRREGTLPPLSELMEEGPMSRPKNLDTVKTPLRRTSSGGNQVTAKYSLHKNEDRNKLVRPKSSHGRRRPMPSEIMELHSSMPAPYEDSDVFTMDNTSPRSGLGVKTSPGSIRDSRHAHCDPAQLLRPKSSKGRSRPVGVSATRSLSQGDEWSSDEEVRPRAPSPPSPGLDSDLDSDNETYDGNYRRNVRPR